MTAIVLDAGAFIAFERGGALMRTRVRLATNGRVSLMTSSAVVAQVWRDGARQAQLARLLNSDLVVEVALGPDVSRRLGALVGAAGSRDVVDAHVAAIALEHDAVVATSDPDDIARFGVPAARILRC